MKNKLSVGSIFIGSIPGDGRGKRPFQIVMLQEHTIRVRGWTYILADGPTYSVERNFFARNFTERK